MLWLDIKPNLNKAGFSVQHKPRLTLVAKLDEITRRDIRIIILYQNDSAAMT